MDKFLKSFSVGRATFFLGGHFTVLDKNGRKKDEGDVGLFLDPRDLRLQEDDCVVFENQVEISGFPGPGIHYEILAFSISEDNLGRRIAPAIINRTDKITVWRSEGTIAVFVGGKLCTDNWVISHQESFSGRIFFDAAENKIQDPEPTQAKATTEPEKVEVKQTEPKKTEEPTKTVDPKDIAGSELASPPTVARKTAKRRSKPKDEELPKKKGKPKPKDKDDPEDGDEPIETTAPSDNEVTSEEIAQVVARQGTPPNGRLDLSGIRPS